MFVSGASKVTINNGFAQDVDVKDGKIVYTVWNDIESITVTPVGAALNITKINYHVTDKNYITYAGTVTKNDKTLDVEGVHVYFDNAVTNADVDQETWTDANGDYYLILESPATGTIYFEKDHLLDKKIELNGATTSDFNADEDLEEAVELSGVVYQQKPGTEEYVVASGVELSFEPEESISWPIDTKDDGSFTFKVKKGSSGEMYFYKAGWAADGYTFENLQNDQTLTDVKLHVVGAFVDISGDVDNGHDYFIVDYYYQGEKYLTQTPVTTDTLAFAEDGVFSCGYDENFNHVLEYDFPGEDFHITLTPVAQDGFTFWSWSYVDPQGNRHVLNDTTEKIGPLESQVKYTFYVDYAESTEVTVGANPSEGHAGWTMVYKVNHVVQGTYNIPADKPLTFSLPVSTENANAEEEIGSTYGFDGSNFNVTVNSEFESAETGDPVPYLEERIFTPIPAEGYQFVGIAVNDVDMAAGEVNPIADDTALNVLAKYSLINVNAQTGDETNTMWLFAIAIIAMLGVAYGASRKQKGIRC